MWLLILEMSIYALSFKKTLKNSKNAIFDHFWPFERFWPFLPLWPFCPFLPFSFILIHFYYFSTIFIHFQPFLTIFVHFWLVTIRISVFWPVRGVFFKQRPQNWCSPPYFQPTEPKNWEQAQSLSTTYSRSPLPFCVCPYMYGISSYQFSGFFYVNKLCPCIEREGVFWPSDNMKVRARRLELVSDSL